MSSWKARLLYNPPETKIIPLNPHVSSAIQKKQGDYWITEQMSTSMLLMVIMEVHWPLLLLLLGIPVQRPWNYFWRLEQMSTSNLPMVTMEMHWLLLLLLGIPVRRPWSYF
jgi:hypothetical protein